MSYIIEIADFFLARFSVVGTLDPSDYTLIAEWEKQGIPAPIVLRSMNEIFYDLKELDVKITSVGQCDAAVKISFRRWLGTKDFGI